MINSYVDFADVADEIKKIIGYELLTITRIYVNRMEMERIYSTNPTEYPINNVKPLYEDAWTIRVVYYAQVYLATSEEEMIAYFPNFLMKEGFGSVINIPVITNDREVVATINALNKRYFYNKNHVDSLKPFAKKVLQLLNL